MLSGGIIFYPKINKYINYHMKIMEYNENGETNIIIDKLLNFEYLFNKAKKTYDIFNLTEQNSNRLEEFKPSIITNENRNIYTGSPILNSEIKMPKYIDEGDYHPIIINEQNYTLCIKLRILHRMEGEYQISGVSYKKYSNSREKFPT